MQRAALSSSKRKPPADSEWVKTPYPNLICYKPSGNYFGRVRVNGKLIRRSLETHVLSVAKLRSERLQRLGGSLRQGLQSHTIQWRVRRRLDSFCGWWALVELSKSPPAGAGPDIR